MKNKANGLRWREQYSIEILMAKVALLAMLFFAAFIAIGYFVFIHFDIL